MQQKARTNERIRALRCRLIDATGTNHGEVSTAFAMGQAKQAGLDLVEVSPGLIPICKIMDYGRVMYQQSKSEKHQKHAPAPKEIRISYLCGEADLQRQVEKTKTLLGDNHRVTFVMTVKGRERFVGQGSAKERFTAVVQSIDPNINTGDIKENTRGFNVTFHPHNG